MTELLMMEERLKKTLYYGEFDMTVMTQPSLPLTKIAVQMSKNVTSKRLGHIDLDHAAFIERSAGVTPCQMVLGLMYMKRVKKCGRLDYLQNVTSSDVFLLSMMMASKYLYDHGTEDEMFNDEWAEIGGVDVEDMNQAEAVYLTNLDWNLFVRQSDFDAVLIDVERSVALNEGLDRGWFSYTELSLLYDPSLVPHICAQLLEAVRVIVACSVAYLVGIATITVAVWIPHAVLPRSASPWSVGTQFITTGASDCLVSTAEISPVSRGVINLEDLIGLVDDHGENTTASDYTSVVCAASSTGFTGGDRLSTDVTPGSSSTHNLSRPDASMRNGERYMSRNVALVLHALEHSLVALVFGFDRRVFDQANDTIGQSGSTHGATVDGRRICERCRVKIRRSRELGTRDGEVDFEGGRATVDLQAFERIAERGCGTFGDSTVSSLHSPSHSGQFCDRYGARTFGHETCTRCYGNVHVPDGVGCVRWLGTRNCGLDSRGRHGSNLTALKI